MTVVDIETVRTMGTEDLQGIHHIEADEIILLGAHLMGEGQEGNDPGHIPLMKGTMLVVLDRRTSTRHRVAQLLGKAVCNDLYEFGWTIFRSYATNQRMYVCCST